MRLGQLARKLDRKPNELVVFLEKEHQITLDSDLNTKVEGEALELVKEAFKKEEPIAEVNAPAEEEEVVPEIAIEIVEEEVVVEPTETVIEEVEIEISEEEIEDIAAEAVVAEIDEEEADIALQDATEPEEKGAIEEVPVEETIIERIARVGEDGEELPELIIEGGVIKAPKPELDGFTVVGKIELPSAKRSIEFFVTDGGETKNITEEIYETRKREKESSKKKAFEARKARKSKQQNKRPRKVLTDADRKAHTDRRTALKKTELEKKQAEKKKRHYEENVQKKAAVHSKKKKQKEIEKAVKKQKAPKEPLPTTAWGKFKRWLNT